MYDIDIENYCVCKQRYMSDPKEKTLRKLAQEFPEKTYHELEKYRDADRQQEALHIPLTESQQKQEELEPIEKGVCVTGAMRKDRELEMKILRSEVEALKQQLHTDREKYKKENNDLYNRIADALAVNESHQKMNGKLQEKLTELEQDNLEMYAENKKMHNHLNKQVDNARKSGM